MNLRFRFIVAGVAVLSLGLSASPGVGRAQEEPQADPLHEMASELSRLESRIDGLEGLYQASEGADRELFDDQLRRRWVEHHEVLGRLVERVDSQDGSADPVILLAVRAAIEREVRALETWSTSVGHTIAEARAARPDTPLEELLDLEIELSELNATLDRGLTALADNYEYAETLGLDLAPGGAALDSMLAKRAAFSAASTELALERRSRLEERRSKPGVDTMMIDIRLAAVEERIGAAAATLRTMVGLLDRRGVEADAYEQLLLTTGGLSVEVLDPEVVGGLLSGWWEAGTKWLAANAATIVVRLLTILFILFITAILARLARRAVTGLLGSRLVQLSQLLKGLVVGTASKLVWLLGLLIVLSVLGVNIGPALAGLGIAGFVLGFALQDSLSNFAAGLMIMIYRPFDVGDVVTAAGVTGKVKDLTLVSTVITTLDNQLLVVPNGKIWGDVINNVTGQTQRRVDMVFGIGYDDDLRKAQRILEEILASHDLVLDDPKPVVRVHNLGDSSVDFICRPWCRTDDYWEVYWDVTQAAKERFDEEGISIPFPQRDVHVYPAGGAPAEA